MADINKTDDLFYDENTYMACPQNRKDCFSYLKDGTCDCLANTEFKKSCPFYMKKKEYLKRIKEEAAQKRKNPSTPF